MTGRMEEIVGSMRRGRLVVIPTDTVYGVAALPRSRGGVLAIFAAKGRSLDKPIPVLGMGVDDLSEVAAFDARARALAEHFWPGPLTLVVPRSPAWAFFLGGDSNDSVAVRAPAHDVARDLLVYSGPLAVTSANRSGEPEATTLEMARASLGDAVAHYIEGGTCSAQASTIVSLVGRPKILRAGSIGLADIQNVTS